MQFVPTTFGVVGPLQDPLKGAPGDLRVLFFTGSQGELSEGHGGEGVGEDVVRFYQRTARAVQTEVPVVVPVVAVALQEVCSVQGTFQPLRPGLELVVELGEGPYLAGLQPEELIGVIDLSPAV